MAFGFFDGQKADFSPESIKRKRAMIAQLLSGGRAPRNIGEGFSSIGDSVAAAMLGYQADTAEKANNAERSRIMGGIYGGGVPMAAVGGAPVATGSATGSGATRAVAAPEALAALFAENEAKYSLPSGYLTKTARIESNFDPNAQNPNSSAGGLFQFINSTARQYGLANRFDAGAATAAAARLAADNRDFLARRLGREPTAGELYLAHQQGARGAAKLLTNPDAPASSLVGEAAARLNRGANMTARAFANQWTSKFDGMPAVQPGPSAAPMPLARQQAQTAPMPNAGLSDMPAPGANPAMNGIAPIQGDNRAALLADADYYEQNGNVEAARQMRARAGMAEQAQMGPADASQLVYRGELNNVPAGELIQRGPMPSLPEGFDTSSLITPASAPVVPGGGVAIADNEADTQFLEARMAAAQGQPMPAPAPEPVPVNTGDVFSPIPMGAAPNPFVQRAPFEAPPPADVNAVGSQPISAEPVPMPPRRPADLAPVQPVVQPPIQQPPLDQMTFAQQGAANSMDDRFAAQSFASGGMGQAGPRRSILDGLMGGSSSPFVPVALRAPQPVVPGQSAPMGGSTAAPAAQAQQTGMITPDYVRAVMSSNVTTDADKRYVMDMYNQQVALQRAEAERARTEAQNRQTARDLGIPESLGGVGPVVTARAQQMYARPEAATTDQRELEQVNRERRAANLPPFRMDEYKIEKAKAGATSITNDLTGGSSKQIFDTLKERADAASTAATGLNALREARKAVNDGGFFGAGADTRLGFAKLGQLLGFEDGRITNVETFRSAIAPQVAAVMKATVGSTQISNQDREFAEKAAGGNINLDEKSIKRLLDIMERSSNDIITRHQKQLDAVYPESPDGKFARERALFGVQAPPAPTQTGPARPTSKAEFDALKSGTLYVDPEGNERRKR